MIAHEPDLVSNVIESDRRKITRASVAIDTLMYDRDGHTFGARILNISNGGLMATTEAPLCERDPVRIDLPTIGWVRCEIVWVLGDRVGARFRDGVDENELTAFKRVFA